MKYVFIRKPFALYDTIMGWVPERMIGLFQAGDTLTVAHDIFEHRYPNDRGEMHFELMAVGAAFYVRESYRMGMLGAEICFSDVWYSIFHQILHYYYDFLNRPPILGEFVGRTCKLEDEEAEDQFKRMIEKGTNYEMVANELSYYARTHGEEMQHLCKRLRTESIHWLRMGYRHAAKRFKNIGRYSLGYAFYTIQEDIARLYSYKELTGEGDRMIIHFKDSSPENYRINFDTIYEMECERYP